MNWKHMLKFAAMVLVVVVAAKVLVQKFPGLPGAEYLA